LHIVGILCCPYSPDRCCTGRLVWALFSFGRVARADSLVARLATTWANLHLLDLSKCYHIHDAGFRAIWSSCASLQDLRLRGARVCNRVRVHLIVPCVVNMYQSGMCFVDTATSVKFKFTSVFCHLVDIFYATFVCTVFVSHPPACPQLTNSALIFAPALAPRCAHSLRRLDIRHARVLWLQDNIIVWGVSTVLKCRRLCL